MKAGILKKGLHRPHIEMFPSVQHIHSKQAVYMIVVIFLRISTAFWYYWAVFSQLIKNKSWCGEILIALRFGTAYTWTGWGGIGDIVHDADGDIPVSGCMLNRPCGTGRKCRG